MAVAKVVKSVVKKETRGRKRKRGRGIGTNAEKAEAKKLGIRPILRKFTPRYYIVYAERKA